MEHGSALPWSPAGATGIDGVGRSVARAALLLDGVAEADWQGVAARAFTRQALTLRDECARLAAQVDEVAHEVAAVRAELALTRAAMAPSWPWWQSR